jgi:hypothetical protein
MEPINKLMKKISLIFIIAVTFMACNSNCEKPAEQVTPIVQPAVKNPVVNPEQKAFSNPALIYGSDFGHFFRALYAQGKFEDMVKFTSSETVNQFGHDALIDFYKNKFKFGYELGTLGSITKEGNSLVLNYPKVHIIATKKVVRITVVIEHDSCKIVLSNNLLGL